MEREFLEEVKRNLEFVNDNLKSIRESNQGNRMDIKEQADFHRFAEAQYCLAKTYKTLRSIPNV